MNVLVVPFLAPIPVGHRVQLIYAGHWSPDLFGGQASWMQWEHPVVVDRDSGITYADWVLGHHLVSDPLAFKPNSGYQVTKLTECRVTSCMVRPGEDQGARQTTLGIAIDPEGYRQ